MIPSQERPHLEVVSFVAVFQAHIEFYLRQEKVIRPELKAWGFDIAREEELREVRAC